MFREGWLIFRGLTEKLAGDYVKSKSEKIPVPEMPAVAPVLKAKKTILEMCDDVAWSIIRPEDDCFKRYEGGEFSDKERRSRTEILGPGITILRDVGLFFYQVVDSDTLDKIKQKLGKFPEFAYLKEMSRVKIKSFNIPPHLLQLGMWIPLPSPPGAKENLSDDSFKLYCNRAIDELRKDPVYGEKMSDLELLIGREAIVSAMLAVAKAESGGVLGKFADRRYENGHKAFSYTIFHVLMVGAGLKARRKLAMTTGQSLHPRNSVKLFLAFLFEKAGKKGVAKYFPLNEHYKEFATFYNGNWQGRTPSYPDELRKYYPVTENPVAKR